VDKPQPVTADPMEALTRGLEAILGIVFVEKTPQSGGVEKESRENESAS
jgi:hypothetical protein